MSTNKRLIENAGGCVVSNNILEGKGHLKWCVRENPINELDNGWRFLSEIDDDDYLSVSSNMSICDYNTVANIEPAILAIYDCKIGTDLTLINEAGKKFFWDNLNGVAWNISQ